MTSSRPVVFETRRLWARDWAVQDAAMAFEMYGDPEVVRFLGVDPEPDLAAMYRRIEFLIERNRGWPDHHGSFPLFQREDERLIGTAILKELVDRDQQPCGEIEIGWHLNPAVWGRGYATEAGRALLRRGFVELGVAQLHAVVLPDNHRSAAVARRLGMRHAGRTTRFLGGIELDDFVLRREQWSEVSGA